MRYSPIVALILSTLLIGLLQPNAFGLENLSEEKTLIVELDVFSGRENPHWNLTAGREAIFLKKLQALNRTEEEFIHASLGYRGFIVDGLEGYDGYNRYDRASIYKGVVLMQSGNRILRFEDRGRSLEMWLLDTGRESLPGELYAQILSEIEDNA